MVSQTVLPAPAPVVLPEVKPFWDATAEDRLVLPQCQDCQTVIWFPRPYCPNCASLNVGWIDASGRGTIYSFTVNRRGAADLPEYRNIGEFVLAYVELAEGPRIMTNIVDCDPDTIAIGQAVELVFHDTGQGTKLPRFRPAASSR